MVMTVYGHEHTHTAYHAATDGSEQLMTSLRRLRSLGPNSSSSIDIMNSRSELIRRYKICSHRP